MARTRTERIESIKTEIEQLAKRQKELRQAQKAQDRANRTKRLCKRAGLLESMLPDTIPLTDEQFKSFLEQTVTTEQSRHILAGLKPQGTATAAPDGAGWAAQENTPPIPKPADTAQASGTGGGTGQGNGAGVSG